MLSTKEYNWYVLKTKPNSYKIAQKNLSNQGIEVFLPLQKITLRKSGKFLTKVKPLFPGYIFSYLNPSITSWRSISFTRGISRILTVDGKFIPVSESVICRLKERCDEMDILKENSKINKGDKVKLINGPFADFIAEVENLDSEQRVLILLDLIGRQVKMKVSQSYLKAI